MKKLIAILFFYTILMLAAAAFSFSCNNTSDNILIKKIVQQTIITDTIESNIDGIKLVILYNPQLLRNNYKAEHESGVPDTSKYAMERGVNNGQIHFPCTNETVHEFKIAREKIVNIISIKYDMDMYDKTDYIFTHDSIYEVHTSMSNAGIFTSSDIKKMPNNINYSEKRKYPLQNECGNSNPYDSPCDFQDNFFNLTLHFGQKNNLKMK